MTSQAFKKANSMPGDIVFEATFLEALTPALQNIGKHGIKVAVNAGASDPHSLFLAVKSLIKSEGLERKLNVAWIEGDDVLEVVKERLDGRGMWKRLKGKRMDGGKGMSVGDAWMEGADVGDEVREYLEIEKFENICTGEMLREWKYKDEIIGAQAYLGGLGIAKAFEEGADIVVCGRVSDASPVIGAAYWWHGWERDNLQELANAFIAGHLIECSNYVCGGNFTGFKEFEGQKWLDIGYPIAEIGKKGEVVITKQQGTGGLVTVNTCKAQLLYEIQGPWYFNSDVTAVLDEVKFEQLSTDRVALSGVRAEPPPPTTKLGITAKGGFQAEVHWFLVGLDIEAKARMIGNQIRHALGDTSRFHVLNFTINGTSPDNPTDQKSATVDFRVFAQAPNVADVSPGKFLRPIIDLIMCGYPGATFHLDFRQGIPKPVQEYYVTLLPQSEICHVVHMQNGRHFEVDPPAVTRSFPKNQPRQESTNVSMKDFGETTWGPLGWLVHARSGDKGSNANVGFWVRHQDEFDWMRGQLSTNNLKGLLANEYSGHKIVTYLDITRFQS